MWLIFFENARVLDLKLYLKTGVYVSQHVSSKHFTPNTASMQQGRQLRDIWQNKYSFIIEKNNSVMYEGNFSETGLTPVSEELTVLRPVIYVHVRVRCWCTKSISSLEGLKVRRGGGSDRLIAVMFSETLNSPYMIGPQDMFSVSDLT